MGALSGHFSAAYSCHCGKEKGEWRMQQAELAILDWIQLHIRSSCLDQIVPVFSSWNNHGELCVLFALLLVLVRRQRRTGLAVGAGLAVDLLVCNCTLKPLIGRIRPFAVKTAVELLVPPPGDASFPSGHTASAFAVVGALWAMKSPLWKPAAVVAAVMGASRLYLYVHWPSDVLAGAAVGWLCGWLGAQLVKKAAQMRKYLIR